MRWPCRKKRFSNREKRICGKSAAGQQALSGGLSAGAAASFSPVGFPVFAGGAADDFPEDVGKMGGGHEAGGVADFRDAQF